MFVVFFSCVRSKGTTTGVHGKSQGGGLFVRDQRDKRDKATVGSLGFAEC